MLQEPFVVGAGKTKAEELGRFGKEGLIVAEVHWKQWSCCCMELPVKALVVGQPLDCSGRYS
jgi:hypothetical protein